MAGGAAPPPPPLALSNRRLASERTAMLSSRWTLRLLWAGAAGALLLGVLFVSLRQTLFDAILDKKLELTPTSEGYGFWHTMPVPIFMKFYFWNVTNMDEVMSSHARPRLQQLGPYVFSEKHLKVNMSWNANGTVTYQQVKTWHFQPEMSTGSLDDNVTTLNVPLLAAAAMVRDMGTFLKLMFNEMVSKVGSQPYVTHSVRQFLFDGYDDPLLEAAQVLKYLMPSITIPFDKFGWFYGRNLSATYDGVFNMDTGRDVRRLGDLHFWNTTNVTTAFDWPCNMINGSAGELFPPDLPRTAVEFYSTDICRSLRVPYKQEMSLYGLPGYRYQADHRMFGRPEVNPDNYCFCTGGHCPPNGLLNETLCRFGVPAFVSFPHMLYVDGAVVNQTIGQQANESLHNFHLDLEPMTGVPLSVRARFQINLLLSPNMDVVVLNDAPTVYLPMLWFENTVDTTPSIAAQFTVITQTVPLAMSVGSYCVLALGVALLVLAALLTVPVHWRRPAAAGHRPLTGDEASSQSSVSVGAGAEKR